MCEGTSYDNLYRSSQPESPEDGMAVSLFQFNYSAIEALVRCLESSGQRVARGPCSAVVRELWSDMCRVEDPRAVVLNWECCVHTTRGSFGSPLVCRLTRLFVDRGHLVIFGDYAARAVINEWDASLLGPNPFCNVGNIAGSSVLRFDGQVLEQCPSSQLVTLATLSEHGAACISGTCQFVVRANAPVTDRYALELLTVMTGPTHDSHAQCSVQIPGQKTANGTAGHVLLRYAKGNVLLAGPHWAELSRCDVELDGMLRYVEENEAPGRARALQAQWVSAPGPDQLQMMQSYARERVCKASPALPVKKR
eukprot:m51a1_g1824 hypothetical protein (309) ;mRNA; r:510668-511594